MNATCSICLDNFSDEPEMIQIPPMATRCGHLYCLTCATFQFAEPGATCAVCRTPQTLDALIKLYPNYSSASEAPGSSSDRAQARLAGGSRRASDSGHPYMSIVTDKILDAFRTLNLDGREYSKTALLITLSSLEELTEVLSRDGPSELLNLLKSLVFVLKEIITGVENTTRLTTLQTERDELKKTIRRVREKLKLVKTHYEEEQRAREAMHHQSELERKAVLENVLRELATEKLKAEMATQAREIAVEEEKQRRRAAARYKKKYHALKQQMRAKGQDSDQSLEII